MLVGIILLFVLWRRPPPRLPQSAVQMLHSGPITLDAEQFHLTNNEQPFVRPRDSNDNRVNSWSRKWRLPQADHGVFLFHLDSAPEAGLVIALQNTVVDAETWATSGGGYAIVYNAAFDRPTSWIGKLPYFDKPMPGSRQNFGTVLQPGDYWVSVQYGLIMMGSGSTPNQNVIVMAHDPSPVQGIQYIGFGVFTRSTGRPVLNNTCQHVSDLRTLTGLLQLATLPNCLINCDGHEQLANIHQMTKERLLSAGITTEKY